jgi:glycosyltransferase involved in cell wall biosynthesis
MKRQGSFQLRAPGSDAGSRLGISAVPRVLFIHRQGPGQFEALAHTLHARAPGSVAMILGAAVDAPFPVMRAVPARSVAPGHPYLRATEAAVLNGQATLRTIRTVIAGGFRPEVVVVHPGWGDALFLPQILPGVPIIAYAEFFYRTAGADLDFDQDLTVDLDRRCALELRNAPLLLALEAATAAIAPTRWQRDLHPAPYRRRISVIHDGVDTRRVRPDQAARFVLPDRRVLTREDEVVTYVARDLEPHRGFPALMRALPPLLAARPRAEVVICGGDGVSYGRPPPDGGSWRATLLAELGTLPPRVHFTGRLPYGQYLALLQVSRLHLYPSAPFVLSWSCVEAMAAGCLVLASDTAPVREVIADGVNGVLVDPRDPHVLASRAVALLETHPALEPLRIAARQTMLRRFRREQAIARQIALIERVARQAPAASDGTAAAAPVAAVSCKPSAATMRGRASRQSGRTSP